jgi:hypothetical protein
VIITTEDTADVNSGRSPDGAVGANGASSRDRKREDGDGQMRKHDWRYMFFTGATLAALLLAAGARWKPW